MELEVQLVVGWLCSLLIERLKKWNAIPWINTTTSTINRIVAAIVAAAAAVGITFQYDPQAGTLLVGGLTLAGAMTFLGTFLWTWLTQFISQKFMYNVLVKKNGGSV